MIYEIWRTHCDTCLPGLMGAYVGCTLDCDYLSTMCDFDYVHENHEDTVNEPEEAIWSMNHDVNYMNAIQINDEDWIEIDEYHLHTFEEDEHGFPDDSGFECWENYYQAGRTAVYTHDGLQKICDTFDEAKEYALKLLNVTVGKE